MSTVFVCPNGLHKECKDGMDFEVRWVMAPRASYALAFEELVDRNESKIYRLAMNMARNQRAAEHLLQDTFIKAHERLYEFRGGSHFSSSAYWKTNIVLNPAGTRPLSLESSQKPRCKVFFV